MVATPIGNLDDITRRAVTVLADVEIIACEDTRRTGQLLSHLFTDRGTDGVKRIAYHDHNETEVAAALVEKIKAGTQVALVSDAGTPGICDPGYRLVNLAHTAGVAVVAVPGASALAATLSICPLPVTPFFFEGFLPAKPKKRQTRLRELLQMDSAVVVFEAPHRILSCLQDVATLDAKRAVFIAREVSKQHEEGRCGTAEELSKALTQDAAVRGEIVMVIDRAPTLYADGETRRLMNVLCKELSPAQAARLAAQFSGRTKSDLYRYALAISP